MVRSGAKSRAQQVRDEYRTLRVRRLIESKQVETLLPPGFPVGAIVDDQDGTLNKDFLTADLPVEMSAWTELPPEGRTSTIQIDWARAVLGIPPDDLVYDVVDSRDITGHPDLEGDFPLILHVPKEQLAADGAYYLRLVMKPYNLGTTLYSQPFALICDSEGPYRHDAPLAMEVPTVPITDEYLDNNDDKVIGFIPQYDDYQPGDSVGYFWAKFPPPDDPGDVTPIGETAIDGVTWPFPVEYLRDVIEAAGDGQCYPLYVLLDKATNISRLSAYAPVNVALGDLPSGMQVPEVPLAVDGLSKKDAEQGVDVVIQRFQDYKTTDTIDITWGTTTLPGVPIGGGSFPMAIRMPDRVLWDTYQAGPGSVVSTPVSYVVSRGGLPSDSLSITIDVDFSIIGPPRPDPDPDWPDPVNPLLALAKVYGENSQTLNTLTRDDEGEDAIVNIELYDPLNADEIISFYWSGIEVPEAQYTVLPSDIAGAPISVTIPWSYIEQAYNNDQLPVHYRIRASESSENEQHSDNTKVNADAVTLRAPAPEFEGGVTGPGGDEYLNCNSIYADPPHSDDPAIRVRVPDLSGLPFNLAAGTVISMSWRVVEGYTGEIPIDAVDFDEDITLGVEYPPTGFIWRVPYVDYIEPIYPVSQDGRGRVTYSFEVGESGSEETILSGQVEGNVAMHTGQGQCQIPPPLFRRKG